MAKSKSLILVTNHEGRCDVFLKITRNLKSVTVSHGALATALGVSRPYISKLAKDGVFVKDESDKESGLFLVESLKNYYSVHAKKPQSKAEEEQEVNYMEEKAKHEAASRKLAELKLAKMEARVYDAHTVELVMTEMLSNLRTQLLGLPTKLAPQIEGKTRAEIYEIMTREIEDKLSELSEYSPEIFTEEEVDDEDSN